MAPQKPIPANALRRMTSNLRLAGIELEFRTDHSGQRIVSIGRLANISKSSSASPALSASRRTRNC